MKNETLIGEYARAYKIGLVIFILGLPTVVGPFIGLGVFVGATAHYLMRRIRSSGLKALFCGGSLGFVGVGWGLCLRWFLSVSRDPTDEAMYPLLGLVLGTVILAGLGVGFIAVAAARLSARRYDKGKIKGINRYE